MVESRSEIERLAAGVLMVGFPGHDIPQPLVDRGVRSFILFSPNVGAADDVRALTSELRARAGQDTLVAIDHEGGRVNRLAATGAASAFPAAMGWAATGDLDLVERASQAAAGELAALGINLNFAPVVDLLADHRNPALGTRCFSDDPTLVARCAAAFAAGHRSSGVAATAKHFAGHGATPVDSHLDLPEIDKNLESLQTEDIVPFRAAAAAGADCLMISHAWYPALDEEPTPATVSRAVGRLARDVVGDRGVVVTDCMEMGAIQTRMSTGQAVVGALQAGTDLVLVSHRSDRQHEALDAIVAAVESGALPRERLEEANRRLDALRGRVRIHGEIPPSADGIVRELTRRAVTLVRDEEGILPLSRERRLGVVGFSSRTASQVEGATVVRRAPLAERVAERHPAIRAVTVEPDMPVQTVIDALADVETVLVGTAFATGRPVQAEVVRALHQAGKRVVVLALADPFDLLAFPQVACFLAAYDETPVMIDSALDVLFGEAEARGRLPVALPGLYPRGHRA